MFLCCMLKVFLNNSWILYLNVCLCLQLLSSLNWEDRKTPIDWNNMSRHHCGGLKDKMSTSTNKSCYITQHNMLEHRSSDTVIRVRVSVGSVFIVVIISGSESSTCFKGNNKTKMYEKGILLRINQSVSAGIATVIS